MLNSKKEKKVTCIICPESCKISVIVKDDSAVAKGAKCPRGEEYAIKEIKEPRRIFTSTVRLDRGIYRVCSVKTSSPIKKDDWIKAREIIYKMKVKAPIEMNQILIKDFLEKDINLVSTRKIEKKI